MDEPEKVQDDKTSEQTKETPVEKVYTKADIDKIRSDAAAEVGRATKAAETAAEQARKASERTNKYIEQSRVAELENKKDEPSALDIIRARHAKEELEDELAAKNAELDTTKQAMETIRTQTEEATRAKDAQEIATRFQVDVNDLLLTDGSKEAMEKLAQKLTKVETTPLRVDPGGGVGSSESFETLLKPLPRDASYQDILEREQELKSAMKAQ